MSLRLTENGIKLRRFRQRHRLVEQHPHTARRTTEVIDFENGVPKRRVAGRGGRQRIIQQRWRGRRRLHHQSHELIVLLWKISGDQRLTQLVP